MSKFNKETLTFRDLIQAQLDGNTVQYCNNAKEGWKDLHVTLATNIGRLDSAVNTNIYRIKPETKTVRVFNGVELPDCITEPLRFGEPFYVVTTGCVVEFRWSGLDYERDFVKDGFAYLKREDAEIHHKALTTYETIERPKE